jgi:hypothetical protein
MAQTEIAAAKCRRFRSRVVTIETTNSLCNIEKARRRQSAPCSADHERGNKGMFVRRILFHQVLKRFRDLMNSVPRRELQGIGELFIGRRFRPHGGSVEGTSGRAAPTQGSSSVSYLRA